MQLAGDWRFAGLPFPVRDHGCLLLKCKSSDRRGEAGWTAILRSRSVCQALGRRWRQRLDVANGNPRRPDGPVAFFEGDP